MERVKSESWETYKTEVELMAIDTKQWYDRFWQLYDERIIVISPLFYSRLIQKEPQYYAGWVFRHQCIQLEWFYENRSMYGCCHCRLHGKYIEMGNEGHPESEYTVHFRNKNGAYKPVFVMHRPSFELIDVSTSRIQWILSISPLKEIWELEHVDSLNLTLYVVNGKSENDRYSVWAGDTCLCCGANETEARSIFERLKEDREGERRYKRLDRYSARDNRLFLDFEECQQHDAWVKSSRDEIINSVFGFDVFNNRISFNNTDEIVDDDLKLAINSCNRISIVSDLSDDARAYLYCNLQLMIPNKAGNYWYDRSSNEWFLYPDDKKGCNNA